MIGSPASVTESFETSVIVALTFSPCSAMRELPISRQPAASAAPSPRNLRQDVALGRRLAEPLAAVGSTTLMCCMVISPVQKGLLFIQRSGSVVPRERVAEHRPAALGLLPGRLILDDIPVLDEESVLDAEDVRRDPVRRRPEPREATVDDDKLALRHDNAGLVLQGRRK